MPYTEVTFLYSMFFVVDKEHNQDILMDHFGDKPEYCKEIWGQWG